jgi:hypothetical protein
MNPVSWFGAKVHTLVRHGARVSRWLTDGEHR